VAVGRAGKRSPGRNCLTGVTNHRNMKKPTKERRRRSKAPAPD
jgi:hypothetical protein